MIPSIPTNGTVPNIIRERHSVKPCRRRGAAWIAASAALNFLGTDVPYHIEKSSTWIETSSIQEAYPSILIC